MAEKPINEENKADNVIVSVTGLGIKEADLIRVMEKAGTYNTVVQKPKGQVAHTNRCAVEEYPAKAADEFEINNRGLPASDKAGTHNRFVQKPKSQVAYTDRCAVAVKENPAKAAGEFEINNRVQPTLDKTGTHNRPVQKPKSHVAQTGRCAVAVKEYPAKATGEFKVNHRGLPALDLEEYEHKKNEENGVADKNKGSTCYAWIGAGQCGGQLVKSFYDLGYRKVLAVNTNRRDLDLLAIGQSHKYLMDMDEEINGRDMETGAKAVQQHRQDILHLFQQTFGPQVNHIMVCFGAGGRTGSGSVVELIDIAKRYARFIGLKNPSKSVGVIMTLPASGKIISPLVAQNAYKVANELSQMANAGEISPLIIVDNDKISKMYPEMATKPLRLSINRTFAGLYDFFNKVSALGSPYTSFDRLDYLNVIESGGCLVMGRTKVDKLDEPFSISEAVKNNFENTLFAGGLDLSTVKTCGCIVVGGRELMATVKGLQEKIDYAFYILSEMTGEATIHRGIYEDNSDSVRVFTIIGGLNSPTDRLDKLNTDLYFRPDIFETGGLQLRDQREDILSLAEYFLAKEADFYNREDKILNSDSQKLLLYYSWPGNIRELAKAMGRAHELTIGRIIHPDALPFKIIFADFENYPKHILPILYKVQRRIIIKTLELFQGRILSAARILGIEPQRLNQLIKKLNISVVEINTRS
ncbi:MAG: AAA-type ATPase lid domain-containing protein [Planctomycetota bacterium]